MRRINNRVMRLVDASIVTTSTLVLAVAITTQAGWTAPQTQHANSGQYTQVYKQPALSQAERKRNAEIEVQRRNQLEEKISTLNKAIKKKPGTANLYAERAQCHMKMSRFQLALIDYNQAIKLNPVDVESFSGRAQVLEALHKPRQALADFQQVAEMEPINANALSNLAMAELRSGSKKKAREHFEKAITLHPNYNDYYQLAELSRNSGDTRKANHYMELARNCPENGIITSNSEPGAK